ncbi:MAG: hypothetical protein ACOY94_13790 [Bacillota bacterium]
MSSIKINLLLKEYAPPRKAGRLEWAIAAALALATVAGGVYYTGVAAEAAALARQAESQERQLHRVTAKLAEAATIRQREERVARAEGELKGLEGRHWSGVLLTLRDLTPQHVTWQALNIEGESMTLKASSRGLVDVAQLFAGLITSPEVAEVSLRYVNEAGIPVQMTAEQGQPVPKPEAIRPAGTFRQLEFEIVITLVPQGGRVSNGA